jgi:hypothetical protein
MPSNVSNFLGLSILGWAIGIVSAYFGFQEAVAKVPVANAATIVIVVDVIAFAISFGLIAAIGWGRQNWARWVTLIFFLFGLVMLAVSFQKVLQLNSFQIGTTLVQTALKAAALFFIFTGNAKEWFGERKA